VNTIRVYFLCGKISLEGELHLLQGNGSYPGVIVCHPHPLYGGDMHNNVVDAVCEALFKQSITALRFNFRGVGGSGGTFGGGIGEQDDVKATLTFLRSMSEIDTGRIGLVGYSFGASVVLPVAIEDDSVALLSLISPALGKPGWEQLETYRKPKFLIVGEADSFVPLGEFKKYNKTASESEQYEIVSGTDHFWWGKEQELAGKVTRFFATGFNIR